MKIDALFSLTPARSRWERENCFQLSGKPTDGFCSKGKTKLKFSNGGSPPMNRSVAQVGNLLYRRLAVGGGLASRTAADCQSATPQTASLRYNLAGTGSGKQSTSLRGSWNHSQRDRAGVRENAAKTFRLLNATGKIPVSQFA
jgi:hypothetical protein